MKKPSRPFAPGTAHAVAELLQPAMQQVFRNQSEKVQGPWSQVANALRGLSLALSLRDLQAIDELARVGGPLFNKLFIRVVASTPGEKEVAMFTLALMQPDTITRFQRMEALAAYLDNDARRSPKLKLLTAAETLHHLAPDLFRERPRAELETLVFSALEQSEVAGFLDAFSKEVAVPAGYTARQERIVGRILTRHRLPPLPDGRAIVRAAARLLGLSAKQADNLFNARRQIAARRRRLKRSS